MENGAIKRIGITLLLASRFCFASNMPIQSLSAAPPRGWNSYLAFGPNCTEDEFVANCLFMARNLRQHGYKYCVLDIDWFADNSAGAATPPLGNIDDYGRPLPSISHFPSSRGRNGSARGFSKLWCVHSWGARE